MAGQKNPDIQRLLANLRGGSPAQSSRSQLQGAETVTHQTSIPSQSAYSNSLSASIPGLGLLPSENKSSQPPTISRSIATESQSRPLAQPESSKDRSSTPVLPDSSTITTWPAALKYVTKHIVSNENVASNIKRLIREQQKHERQWWAGREAIVTRHSGRAGNQAKVADLLKSLGGATVPVIALDPKADQAELDAYDQKVYKRLIDMTADFDRQLRSLQVPFFAIKHDLVDLNDGGEKESEVKGKIDKGELRELQRKMAETLEDLLGDD